MCTFDRPVAIYKLLLHVHISDISNMYLNIGKLIIIYNFYISSFFRLLIHIHLQSTFIANIIDTLVIKCILQTQCTFTLTIVLRQGNAGVYCKRLLQMLPVNVYVYSTYCECTVKFLNLH